MPRPAFQPPGPIDMATRCIHQAFPNEITAPRVNPQAPAAPQSIHAPRSQRLRPPAMIRVDATRRQRAPSIFMFLQKPKDLNEAGDNPKDHEHEVEVRCPELFVQPVADQVSGEYGARQDEAQGAVLAGNDPDAFLSVVLASFF